MHRKLRIMPLLLGLALFLELLPCAVLAAEADAFDDVPSGSWYYDDVMYVSEQGLITGTSANTFSPDMAVTRGMLVTILFRLEGEPDATDTAFMDIADNAYYAKAVAWAAEEEIVSGYSDAVFGPEDAVTREQLATILYRYAIYKGLDTVTTKENLSSFTDVAEISNWAVSAVNWMVDQGLFSGIGDGTLKPTGTATRAQTAAILRRYLGNLTTEYAIAEPTYPNMSQYPEETLYWETENALYEQWKAGEITEEEYSSACDELEDEKNVQVNAWSADRRAQLNQPQGYADSLDAFFEASIVEFLSEAETENRIYSPVNVYMALAMLAELTDGESRRQILELLGSENINALRAQVNAVWNANYCDDGSVTSLLASSVWLNEGIEFYSTPLETLAEVYYAASYQGELGSDEMNQALRDWLNKQTGGMLSEQVDNVHLDAGTLLALATTVYFRAKWDTEFSESMTESNVFHGTSGNSDAEYMRGTRIMDYFWGENFSAVALSLCNSGAVWFLLPDEGFSVDELLKDAEAMKFLRYAEGYVTDWENSTYLCVNLSIPKFDVASHMDLKVGLQSLGITDVFNATASDFSPVSDETLSVSGVLHDARVVMDEEGIIATSYTMIPSVGSGRPPEEEVDFVLDKPFLFLLTGYNKQPLFAGVINQP